ncbi:MAG: hypothetical protein AAF558_04835 [Verrucomicrobiota bacterium]
MLRLIWFLVIALVFDLGVIRVFALEVIPSTLQVEAGGAAAQLMIRGPGVERIQKFQVYHNGSPSPYFLVRKGGASPGQITLLLFARPDVGRQGAYILQGGGQAFPVALTVVEAGQAQNREPENRSVREVVETATESRVIVAQKQAPKVLRTMPNPLVVPPSGQTTTVTLQGTNLDAIDDVRVRKASAPAQYRGKKGKLPFRKYEGDLMVDVVASTKTMLGESYVLDLMVGKYKAVSVKFVIGHPAPAPPEPVDQGPRIIVLPPEASGDSQN